MNCKECKHYKMSVLNDGFITEHCEVNMFECKNELDPSCWELLKLQELRAFVDDYPDIEPPDIEDEGEGWKKQCG